MGIVRDLFTVSNDVVNIEDASHTQVSNSFCFVIENNFTVNCVGLKHSIWDHSEQRRTQLWWFSKPSSLFSLSSPLSLTTNMKQQHWPEVINSHEKQQLIYSAIFVLWWSVWLPCWQLHSSIRNSNNTLLQWNLGTNSETKLKKKRCSSPKIKSPEPVSAATPSSQTHTSYWGERECEDDTIFIWEFLRKPGQRCASSLSLVWH